MRIFAGLNQIKDNRYQARTEYGDLAELAADIMRQKPARRDTLGLQQVPTARLIGDDGEWVPVANMEPEDFLENGRLRPGWEVELEFGHRRKRAFVYLAQGGAHEYGSMPLDLRDLDDEQMLDGVWQENRSRRDLSSVEEAELLQRKLAQLGNQRAVGEAWGIARATVANKLALLELPPEIQQANREGRLSERAALSLLPVVKIEQMSNGAVKWAEDDLTWGAPLAPGRFVQKVVSTPGVTSDEIRRYAQQAVAHAGLKLPKGVAEMVVPDCYKFGGVVQPSCRGCPARLNEACLNARCLADKKDIYGLLQIREAAAELNLPAGDVIQSRGGEGDLMKIHDMQQAGAFCEHVRVGWTPGGAFIRPFHRFTTASSEMAFSGENRSGVVLYHAGEWAEACLPPGAAVERARKEEKPGDDQMAAWSRVGSRAMGRWRKGLIEAMTAQLRDWPGLSAAMLLSNYPQWKEGMDKGDVGQMASAMAQHLYQRSKLVYGGGPGPGR